MFVQSAVSVCRVHECQARKFHQVPEMYLRHVLPCATMRMCCKRFQTAEADAIDLIDRQAPAALSTLVVVVVVFIVVECITHTASASASRRVAGKAIWICLDRMLVISISG